MVVERPDHHCGDDLAYKALSMTDLFSRLQNNGFRTDWEFVNGYNTVVDRFCFILPEMHNGLFSDAIIRRMA